MAAFLGVARCPVCGSGEARASLMKTARVCITCNSCRVQVMARGDESDARMRDLVAGRGAQDAPPKPKPAPVPAPAPVAAAPAVEPFAEPPAWGALWR